MAREKHTSWHHGFFLKIFRALLGVFFRSYYRFKRKKIAIKKTGPYLILANHTAEFDIIFLDMLFDAPLYFVASDQLLNSGKGSWVLKIFFNPIPKSKSLADLAVVKRMKRVIDEGGNVAIFPEGNASMNGGPSRIPSGMGRLIKFLDVPVKMIGVNGLYLSAPRWAYFRKFGPSTMQEIKTISIEDIRASSAEALETLVHNTLHLSAYDHPLGNYRGRRKAEGLHKLIFTCPQCRGLFTTQSQGDNLQCRQCSFTGRYDERGYLHIQQKTYDLITLDRENLQRFDEIMQASSHQFQYHVPVSIAFWRGGKSKRTAFKRGQLQISEKGVKLFKIGQDYFLNFDEIFSEAIQVRTKLLIYPRQGPMWLLRFPRFYSPYAVMNVIKWFKRQLEKGPTYDPHAQQPSADTFLGL